MTIDRLAAYIADLIAMRQHLTTRNPTRLIEDIDEELERAMNTFSDMLAAAK